MLAAIEAVILASGAAQAGEGQWLCSSTGEVAEGVKGEVEGSDILWLGHLGPYQT